MNYQLTISLLVSNRIDTIRKCLESIKPLLTQLRAELIVVDTGSTDGSIEIVKEYTDKIIPFTWCNDFSAARNVALKAAKGQWFLYLDDDEWFEDVSEIIHFFQAENYMSYGRAFYIQRNYEDINGNKYSDAPVLRMFQITENVHFKYRIHEAVTPELDPLKVFDSYVHHYGYIGTTIEKNRRNVSLLEMELQENPRDIRMLSQLINEYCVVKEYAKVLQLQKNISAIKRGSVTDSLYCYVQAKIAESHLHIGQVQNAIQYANQLLQQGIYNPVTEAYLYIVLLNAYLEDAAVSEESGKKALQSYEHYLTCIKEKKISKEDFSKINLFELGKVFQEDYTEKVRKVLQQHKLIDFSPSKLEHALIETEQFFEQCSREYPLALSAYKSISQNVDRALQQKDNTLLLSQLPILETGDGALAFQYIGEARQLLRILNIISLERKYQTVSFHEQIDSKQGLIEKYKLSLFSLRRILFALSVESMADAEYFLQQNTLSPFAIYILAKEELIIPDNSLFATIRELYHLQWNATEMQLFEQLISSL